MPPAHTFGEIAIAGSWALELPSVDPLPRESSRIEHGRVVLVIRPAALPPGTGILLSGGPATVHVQKPGGPVRKLTEPNSLGWGFVKASPRCTGT